MDKNLGATQVATSSTDADSYGYLYQWGKAQGFTSTYDMRNNRPGPVDDTAEAGTSFITNALDWLSTNTTTQAVNNARWAATKTVNDPCPFNFRVPTWEELDDERNIGGDGFWGTDKKQDNAAGAFASVLKLPLAGYRIFSSGTLDYVGFHGAYWSSTVADGTGTSSAKGLLVGSYFAAMAPAKRANGLSVRCIKELE